MPYRKRGQSDKGIYALRGGKGYAVRWLERGKLMCQTLRGYTKTDARTFRNGKINDAKAGRSAPVPGRTTFDDLVKLVAADAAAKQNRSAAAPSRFLAGHFAGWQAAAITVDAVRSFEAARLAGGVVRATLNADLAWLRHALRLAIDAGRLVTMPKIRTPDPRNARQGFFETEELDRVLAKLPPALRPVVAFCYLTGWRCKSEVLPLTWAQVDWRARIVRLEPGTTKNKEGREFPFGALPALRALLEGQLAAAEPVSARFVFFGSAGRRLDYKPVRKAWRSACRAAKVPGRLLHDLRRTAVRNLVRAGVPQVVAMSLTGHKTAAVFHRYAIIDTVMQSEGVAKLATSLAAGSR